MPREQSPGKPTTRQYSEEKKIAAVRMVGDPGGEFNDINTALDDSESGMTVKPVIIF